MVGDKLSKTMFLVLGWVAIAGVLKLNVVETSWHRYHKAVEAKRPYYQDVVTETEVRGIIKYWPRFVQQPFAKDLMVSSHADSIQKSMSWHAKYWFIRICWDANRFFYVQQRVVSLLQYLQVRRTALAVIKQIEARRNDVTSVEMIQMQQKRMAQETFGKAEIAIVEKYEEPLKKIFKDVR